MLEGIISKSTLNGTLHWAWKLAPLVFCCGVLWMKVDSVQQQVTELTKRVASLEACLMHPQGTE